MSHHPTVVVPSGQALQSKSAIRPPVTVATAVKDKPKDKPAGLNKHRVEFSFWGYTVKILEIRGMNCFLKI